MSDYQQKFQSMTGVVHDAAQSVMNKIDHFTFKMLVNCLKTEDYEACKTAIEQLAKEKRPLSIPPLYYVATAHPNGKVREKAWKALEIIGDKKLIEELTQGKTTEEGVKALIQEYGNYREG